MSSRFTKDRWSLNSWVQTPDQHKKSSGYKWAGEEGSEYWRRLGGPATRLVWTLELGLLNPICFIIKQPRPYTKYKSRGKKYESIGGNNTNMSNCGNKEAVHMQNRKDLNVQEAWRGDVQPKDQVQGCKLVVDSPNYSTFILENLKMDVEISKFRQKWKWMQ